ncbi:MAG: VWA domain-containing protein [Deltaproteobacteria bacterium]|nr:VWA domain-containing protein [Deltaproteobacteria bacterium]
MSFETPWLAWVSPAAGVLVVALYFYDRARRRQLTRRLGELPVIGKVMATASPRRRAVKVVLQALAASLLVFSLARPQMVGKRNVELRGLDLVIAVDVSKSMLVDDVEATAAMKAKKVPASRLGRARELAVALIDELPEDRIAPVVFAGAAAHFPLTEDHEVAARFLYDLGPADLPGGSNLFEVFRVGRCLLRSDYTDDGMCASIARRGHGGDPLPGQSLDPKDRPKDEVVETKQERGRAIVILTDGGDVDDKTLAEVDKAKQLGIAVFVVGVGTEQGGVVYEVDGDNKRTATPKHTPDGQTVVSKRDDAGMQAITAAGGDEKRYFAEAGRGEVNPKPVAEALRAVNRGLAMKKIDRKQDVFQPFLFAAFMLFVIEALIATRRRRPHPEEQP